MNQLEPVANNQVEQLGTQEKKEVPETLIVEPKWHQHREDLHYMFGIDVANEEDLYSREVRNKIYDKATSELKNGNAFPLEHFVSEGLMSHYAIKREDKADLKGPALSVIASTRNTARRTQFQKLFLDTGILTENDLLQN